MFKLLGHLGAASFRVVEKSLTGVLIDDEGNILDSIFDGISDGKVVITNSVEYFEKICNEILWGE